MPRRSNIPRKTGFNMSRYVQDKADATVVVNEDLTHLRQGLARAVERGDLETVDEIQAKIDAFGKKPQFKRELDVLEREQAAQERLEKRVDKELMTLLRKTGADEIEISDLLTNTTFEEKKQALRRIAGDETVDVGARQLIAAQQAQLAELGGMPALALAPAEAQAETAAIGEAAPAPAIAGQGLGKLAKSAGRTGAKKAEFSIRGFTARPTESEAVKSRGGDLMTRGEQLRRRLEREGRSMSSLRRGTRSAALRSAMQKGGSAVGTKDQREYQHRNMLEALEVSSGLPQAGHSLHHILG